jgi:addiction module RelB/DinJ family antitoxin
MAYNKNKKGVLPMAKTAQVSIRIDENLKNRSNLFFESCGISFNQGIQILLRKVLREGKLELVAEYNAETLAAIAESEKILANPAKIKSYSSAEEMTKDILEGED